MMDNFKPILVLITCIAIFSISCDHQSASKPLPVIFETDMGNDVDDALALDMLYKYADRKTVNILAVSSNKNNRYTLPFLDIMNTWYGYPGIPLGNMVGGPDTDDAPPADFLQPICEYSRDGKPVFQRSLKDCAKVPEATRLCRKILASQPDTSVVIISVGFSTNIAKLLDTGPDEYSSLAGKELVRKKVKLLSMMAGNVRDHALEFNVVRDPAAARKVFAGWPTEIVVSPSELGISILYPAASINNDFGWAPDHPVAMAYKLYQKNELRDHPTFDLTSVLYAVEPGGRYFDLSERGNFTVDEQNLTPFAANPAGKHRYLKANEEQTQRIKARFVELITAPPAKYRK